MTAADRTTAPTPATVDAVRAVLEQAWQAEAPAELWLARQVVDLQERLTLSHRARDVLMRVNASQTARLDAVCAELEDVTEANVTLRELLDNAEQARDNAGHQLDDAHRVGG